MPEEHRLVLSDPAASDRVEQPGHRLRRVDRVKQHPFRPRQQPDRLLPRLRWDSIPISNVAVKHRYPLIEFSRWHPEQIANTTDYRRNQPLDLSHRSIRTYTNHLTRQPWKELPPDGQTSLRSSTRTTMIKIVNPKPRQLPGHLGRGVYKPDRPKRNRGTKRNRRHSTPFQTKLLGQPRHGHLTLRPALDQMNLRPIQPIRTEARRL